MLKALLIMFLAASVAAVNVPASEYLVPAHVPAILMGSLTFLGASIGMGVIFLIRVLKKKKDFKFLKGRDWLYVGLVNLLDTAANIMLFYGIEMLNGETASLLQSFELVATALVAYLIYKEKLSWRLLLGIVVIMAAAALLFFDPSQGYKLEPGSLLIIGATLCWGFDNNFMKKVSSKDPFEFSFMKCLVPGLIILVIAFATDSYHVTWGSAGYALLDGFVAYGCSVALMAYALRTLTASMGTAIYSMNPFIGAVLSLIFFPSRPSWNFYVALALLLAGEAFVAVDARTLEKQNRKSAVATSDNQGIIKS
jgi:drug/metabolite transporter (DMT)-like permease